jgi:hypothetical protein
VLQTALWKHLDGVTNQLGDLVLLGHRRRFYGRCLPGAPG